MNPYPNGVRLVVKRTFRSRVRDALRAFRGGPPVEQPHVAIAVDSRDGTAARFRVLVDGEPIGALQDFSLTATVEAPFVRGQATIVDYGANESAIARLESVPWLDVRVVVLRA